MLRKVGWYSMRLAIGPRSIEYKNEKYDKYILFAGKHVFYQIISIFIVLTLIFILCVYKKLELLNTLGFLFVLFIVIIPMNYFGQLKSNLIYIESFIIGETVGAVVIGILKKNYFEATHKVRVEYMFKKKHLKEDILINLNNFEYLRDGDEIFLFINRYFFPYYITHNKTRLYNDFNLFCNSHHQNMK